MTRIISDGAHQSQISYDQAIGYGSLDKIDQDKARNTIAIAKALVDRFLLIQQDDEALVAGCGDGTEAALFCDVFGTKTVGVDLSIRNELTMRDGKLQLRHEDLSDLPYPPHTFSLIYSYHVLEHVPDHCKVLIELGRVLRPGGVLLIGFPNKKRAVGYLGAQYHVTPLEKILWNLNDYKYRIQGRFENKLGAHAGFTEKEFMRDAHAAFANIVSVRNEYMRLKYRKHLSLIDTLIKVKLDEYLFPSNYFICTKG
jgi:SAM-dependent methyltransferase